MQPDEPMAQVHLVILKQAVCHSCGWEGELRDTLAEADRDAEDHTH